MALHVQNQIRNNAEEVNGFFQDMVKWEKDIKAKDTKIIQKKLTRQARSSASAPITRQGAGTVAVSDSLPVNKGSSAACHTYDVGYNKWEKLSISESGDMEAGQDSGPVGPVAMSESSVLTPASLVALSSVPVVAQTQVSRPLRTATTVDIETYERERGNSEFKNGNFASAIKCYTKCLGLKPKNYVAFSNRAMAYLKLKEHHKAEADCSCALRVAPQHVKSLLRRASARAMLGKHRAALSDLLAAAALDPANKQAHQERKKVLDSLKSATVKAPSELLCTLWEADYLQQRAREQEQEGAEHDMSGSHQSEQGALQEGALRAGPELPRPQGRGAGPVIDMARMAEEVERELELDEQHAQQQQQHQPEEAKQQGAVLDIRESSDGEWVVLTSPADKTRSCFRMKIEDGGEEEEREEGGGTAETESTAEGAGTGGQAVCESAGGSGVQDKVTKTSSSSRGEEGAVEKNKKEKKEKKEKRGKRSSPAAAPSSSSAGALYSIERQLLSCKGNDKLLFEFLDSIDEKKFLAPPDKKGRGAGEQTLEVDVVVDALLAATRCFGEQRQQWARVLSWFEGLSVRSGGASFSFVAAMFSTAQKEALRAALLSAETSFAGDPACRDRANRVRLTYGLSNC